ncbi:MAG: hypothetical protein PHF86_03545 [Candidatus Nanoarchaeia archaeon]|nr:hypothetical protein [Candidatus Nanoarchaeia archaeon]
MKPRIPDKIFGEPIEGAMERRFPKDNSNPVIDPVVPDINSKNIITDHPDFWTIHNINYNNQLYSTHLLKTLLDNGNSKTQEDWSIYTKNNQFGVADLPFYFALFNTLYQNKNNPLAEPIKQFINKQMLEKWLMTLTRIEYNSNGSDKIIYNYNLTNQSEKQLNIVEPDNFILQLNEPNTLEALVGCNNIQNINDVFKWITGKNTYLWRVNNKPSKKNIRVVGFGAGSGRAYLGCDGDPRDASGALGVYTCAEGA